MPIEPVEIDVVNLYERKALKKKKANKWNRLAVRVAHDSGAGGGFQVFYFLNSPTEIGEETFTGSELTGHHYWDYLPPDRYAKVLKEFAEAFADFPIHVGTNFQVKSL